MQIGKTSPLRVSTRAVLLGEIDVKRMEEEDKTAGMKYPRGRYIEEKDFIYPRDHHDDNA